jgi:Pescadillo N-terminus
MAVLGKKRAYGTREEAIKCLGLTPTAFDRLCILNGVYPKKISAREKINRSTSIQYSLGDLRRLGLSDPQKKAELREYNKKKTVQYKRMGREDKIKRLKDHSVDRREVLRGKYVSFEEALDDLGESVTSVLLGEKILQVVARTHIESDGSMLLRLRKELRLFFTNMLIQGEEPKAFMSRDSGVFVEVKIRGKRILWNDAYPLEGKDSILGINHDTIISFTEMGLYLLEAVNFRLLKDAGHEGFARKMIEEGALAFEEERRAVDMDPIREEVEIEKEGIFKGISFFISPECLPIRSSLALLTQMEGGSLVGAPAEADVCLSDGTTGDFNPLMNHVHPQFVYDSVNKGICFDYILYRPGKELPRHISPFDNSGDEDPLRQHNTSRMQRERMVEASRY